MQVVDRLNIRFSVDRWVSISHFSDQAEIILTMIYEVAWAVENFSWVICFRRS